MKIGNTPIVAEEVFYVLPTTQIQEAILNNNSMWVTRQTTN